MRWNRCLAFGVALFLVGHPAHADPLTRTLTFWGIGDDDGSASSSIIAAGEAQLRVDASAASLSSTYADFKFYHAGQAQMTIAEVYVDDDRTLLDIASLADSGAGVNFTPGSATPPDLPGGKSITPRFEVTAGLLANPVNPAPKNGVSPGEWLTLRFNLKGGRSFQNILDELAGGGLRIGMHVIAFNDGNSASFVNNRMTVVPLPAAAWGGLALLGGIAAGTACSRRLRDGGSVGRPR